MIIKLWPSRSDFTLSAEKNGEAISLNGVSYDFSLLEDGSTLPSSSISSDWILQPVERIDGELVITLILPFSADAPESARFPVDIIDPADGPIPLPGLELVPAQKPTEVGLIDWSKVVTQAMKDAAAAAARLVTAKAELSNRNTTALAQISRIQDRIDTIGFGIEIGEATPEDEAEQAALAAPLKAWKVYKYALGKVTTQSGWFESPAWPVEPPIPEIIASPMRAASQTI